MGWLFGRKKKNPFPQPVKVDENELRFPSKISSGKIIYPDKIKEAAGVTGVKKSELSPLPEMPRERMMERIPQDISTPRRSFAQPEKRGPQFIKIYSYQQVIGELDASKAKISEMQQANRKMEGSEYNEENTFAKLKREVKTMHDDLLQIDKILFND